MYIICPKEPSPKIFLCQNGKEITNITVQLMKIKKMDLYLPWCSVVGATVTVHQFFCILLIHFECIKLEKALQM